MAVAGPFGLRIQLECYRLIHISSVIWTSESAPVRAGPSDGVARDFRHTVGDDALQLLLGGAIFGLDGQALHQSSYETGEASRVGLWMKLTFSNAAVDARA
jgi:hypothetical protein